MAKPTITRRNVSGVIREVIEHKSGLFTMLKGKDGIPGIPGFSEEDLNRAIHRLRQSGKGRELLQEVNENLDTPNHPYNRNNFALLGELTRESGIFDMADTLVDYICFGDLAEAKASEDPLTAYRGCKLPSEELREKLDAPQYQREII